MILNTLIAFLIIFGLLTGWVAVQHLARAYAARHPEHGPAREEGGSCFFCLCRNRATCPRRAPTGTPAPESPLTSIENHLENENPRNQEVKS